MVLPYRTYFLSMLRRHRALPALLGEALGWPVTLVTTPWWPPEGGQTGGAMDPGVPSLTVARCAPVAPNLVIAEAAKLGILLTATEASSYEAFMEVSGYST